MPSILIVEDNWDTQLLISSILRENGYNTHLEADGTKVINKYNEYKPDIILLDRYVFSNMAFQGAKCADRICL